MDFLAGTGTQEDPWQIATPAHLNNIRLHNGAWYKLVNNIDMESANWLPVPNFHGHIDGGGYAIHNFRCTHTDRDCGLIKNQSGGPITIKRLGIFGDSVGVSGGASYYNSYLIGLQTGGNLTIEDVVVRGPINYGGDRGAPVVGLAQNNTITLRRVWADCISSGTGIRTGPIYYRYNGTMVTESLYFGAGHSGANSGATELSGPSVSNESSFIGFDFDALWLMTSQGPELGHLVVVGGNATIAGSGAPVDNVAIRWWTSKRRAVVVQPNEAGDWTASVLVGEYDITYFATGCQPVCHGPYTFTQE